MEGKNENMMEAENENATNLSMCSNIRPSSCPCLLITEENTQIFYDVLSERYHTKFIPDMSNKYIYWTVGSSGWMVLEDFDSKELNIFNIVTMDKVALPSTKSITYSDCILTLPPTDPRCHIVLLKDGIDDDDHDDIDRASKIWFCQPGDDEFTMQDVDDFVFSNIALSKVEENKIYCLKLYGDAKLIIVEFVDPKVARFTHLKLNYFDILSPPPCMQDLETKLIEDYGGELLLLLKIYQGTYTNEVYGFFVYKLDFSNKEWVQLKSLGERAIFLDNYDTGYIIEAKLGVKKNAIYFTEKNDRCFYVYSLENHTITVYMPCQTVSRSPKNILWLHPDLDK